jgi:hypothetical protein
MGDLDLALRGEELDPGGSSSWNDASHLRRGLLRVGPATAAAHQDRAGC